MKTAVLAEWVEEGQDKLHKHDLKAAEILFWKVLTNVPTKKSKPTTPKPGQSRKRLPSILENEDELVVSRPAVAALLGLAEVFTKKGRSVRNNEMEWHRMYIQALASERQAMNCCDKVIEESPEHKLSEWFAEQKSKGNKDLKILESVVVGSLQQRLIKQQAVIAGKVQPKTEEHLAHPCNTEWLDTFQDYCKEKKLNETDWSKYDFDQTEKVEETVVEVIKPPEPPKRKLNYKKVQDAIQRLVQDIASEMRTLNIHPGLTPEEKLNLVSPMSENYDIVKAFEKMMTIDEKSETSGGDHDANGNIEDSAKMNGHVDNDGEKIPQTHVDIVDDDGMVLGESANERGISKGLKYTVKGQEKNLKLSITQHSPIKLEPLMETKEYQDRMERKEFNRTRPGGSFGYTTLKHGVLTVWRSYDNSEHDQVESKLSVPSYQMEAYEELSPLTELPNSPGKGGSDTKEDPLDFRKPNSEGNMNVALAHVITRLADKMKANGDIKESTELYKFSLGIFQELSSKTNASQEPMAHILRNLGIIKCSQGDFIGGSQILENCIKMYEKSNSKNADLLVARTWYDLGNAFLAGQCNESGLYEYVMKSVKLALETEMQRELGGDDLGDDSDDDNSSGGDSYWVSNAEAIECYKNALGIVQRNRPSDEHTRLYVELLNKIGDCSIMSGNYEHAILCYEEAISMFKTIVGSATLENNAHALAMLGTANYLMSNFSKAVSMYDCAQLLHQHLYGRQEEASFEVAFTLTMLGIAFYSMQHFHKSIAWCLKAFELYTVLYKENLQESQSLKKWFVIETLYLLGYSYSTLEIFDKSLHYLEIAKGILNASEDGDAKQGVKVLKCMADVYQATGDEESALELYDEALEWSGSLGYEKSTTALQNKLLNRMAGVHVNSKDYDTAAKYLEQALDCQKNVQNTIKDDLIGVQQQLGLTYTMAGDLDRAIECYEECHEAYEDIPDADSSDIAKNLGTLGTLYHVKACLQDDNDEMLEYLSLAEKHYQEALELDSKSNVGVEYANYLYQQGHCGDALIAMLPLIHSNKSKPKDPLIEYNGVSQAVLLEQIHPDEDELEKVTLHTDIYARFLAVLCYKDILLNKEAEDNLIELLKLVLKSDVPMNHSILGHAMMEMGMYQEAAESFYNCSSLLSEQDSEPALINHWIALCTWAYTTIGKSVYNVLVKNAEDAAKERGLEEWLTAQSQRNRRKMRDSGYYDRAVEKEEEAWVRSRPKRKEVIKEEKWQTKEDTVETPSEIIEMIRRKQQKNTKREEDQLTTSTSDIGYNSTTEYTSSEYLPEDVADTTQTWNEEEETVETPASLLELLKKQQEETDAVLERLSLSHQNLSNLGQEDNPDHYQPEEGLGQKWDRHVTEVEDKSDMILEAIAKRQSQLEGMLTSIKRSVEDVTDPSSSRASSTSLDTRSSSKYLSAHSTEDVRSSRLGGRSTGHMGGLSVFTGRTVSNENVNRLGVTGSRMTKSSEDLRTPRGFSISKSSEDILNDALNSNVKEEDEQEVWVTEESTVETPSEVLNALKKYKSSSRGSLDDYSSFYVADEPRSTSRRSRHEVPMEVSPDEETTSARLGRLKQWAQQRNIKLSSPSTEEKKSFHRGYENTNFSNNNDNSQSSYSRTYTSSYRQSRLGSDSRNNNSDHTHDSTEVSTTWTEESPAPEPAVISTTYSWQERSPRGGERGGDRASRMKQYSTSTSTTSNSQKQRQHTPYTTSSDSLNDEEQGVTNNTFSSRISTPYSTHLSTKSSRDYKIVAEDRAPKKAKQQEHFEEVWTTSEEVVETPPEILKLLMAKQQVH